LLERHLYDQAYLVLEELRLLQADSLDQASLEAIDSLKQHLAVMMRWDRFEWDEALRDATRLNPQQHSEALLLWWQRVVAAQAMLHGEEVAVACTGYELVQDLLLNAERRGRRGWYDDAVARLYRALELLAQTYIQLELGYHHQTFWDDPDIQRDCREWRVRRGVGGLFWWLKHREGGTGLGGAASRQWPVLQQLLDARNHSLLGHGLQPVLQRDWRSLQDRVANLVATALREAGCRQGAPPEQLPGVALLQQPAVSVLIGDT
jgi:CRISPR-associated protein (TIGR02710 family)